METRAHHVLIGLFTLIIFAAVMMFSLWLTTSGSDRQFKLYDIMFDEPVSGLSQGSSVNYSGIRVGDVTQLWLDKEIPSRVWARIRVSDATPIHKDTQAQLVIAGITGTSNIQLGGGTEGSPLLEAGEDEIPVIIATPSSLSQLLSNGGDVVSNINEVLIRLNQVLTPGNQQRLTDTLSNLEQITGTVAEQRENISTILQQLVLITQQSNDTLQQTNKLVRNANVLLEGQGRQVISDAADTMNSLKKASAVLNTLVNENQQSLSHGMQGLSDLGPAVDELRRTLVTLRGAISKLEENPAGLLRGPERIKEFTPQ